MGCESLEVVSSRQGQAMVDLVSGTPQAVDSPIVFGPFELDVRSSELRKAGVRIRLPGQPCKILALLVRRAGTLVTREEIRREVWENDTYVDFEKAINSCVRLMRA